MAELSPVLRKSLRTGLITESAIADADYPKDGCLESINFHFDVIGKAKLRKGSTILGAQIAASQVMGLYFYNSSTTANSKLITSVGTALYYFDGAAWVSKRTITATYDSDFTTFLGYVFMVNGVDATATWDGTASAFSTTVNVTNAPIGKYIENFRARIWIAGNTTYPDRVYYSSIPSAVATPLLTWDTNVTNGLWIDISPSDGENITALKRTKGALLVFKQNHIFQIQSVDTVDADPQINVGTYSKRSLVETKNGLYFHHSSGFYQYSNGGVQEISQPIIDIVNAITFSNYSKVTGWLEIDGNHICWSVGNVTYLGLTYNNLVVRYTISSGTWTHYTYPYQLIHSAIYNTGTSLINVSGDLLGRIYMIDIGKTDNTTPISYSLIHATDSVDDLESTVKRIEKMIFIHTGGQGSKITYKTHKDDKSNFTKTVGQLEMFDTGINCSDVVGTKFQFKIAGSSVGEPFGYEGYEVLTGQTSLVTFK